MIKIIFVTALVLAATSFQIEQNADQKVKIDFYFESLCPYCQQFIDSGLKKAAATKDFWKICEFNIYPYGNARRAQNGSQWSFTCQHGVRECQGNLIETCALRKYELYEFALPFIICLEANSADWISQGKRCAAQLNMDWNKINDCATSSEGNQFEYEMALATEKLNPAHTYVPWTVVNGQHDSRTESAVMSNMVKFVCDNYKGSVKIDACR